MIPTRSPQTVRNFSVKLNYCVRVGGSEMRDVAGSDQATLTSNNIEWEYSVMRAQSHLYLWQPGGFQSLSLAFSPLVRPKYGK